ncbi:cell envelope biogenesis protein TolA, partial [Xanthobacter autotrophicus]|nr:cell envelope biogenesis protein TolA [Xanthobacter autotrophicus]
MRAGIAASTLLHAGVLVLTLVSFTGAKPFEPMTESLPVDVVSISEYTKLTKGARNAPKLDKPKQIAEKVGDPTPVEDAKLKASEKAPVEATA